MSRRFQTKRSKCFGKVRNDHGCQILYRHLFRVGMLAILFLMRGSCAAADTVITNIQELQDINLNPGGSYILANDINAAETADWNNGEGFDPIMDFNGTFDGKGYTIYGLTINRPTTDKVGLFGAIVNDGHVSDVSLYGANISGNNKVGTLAGYLFLADVADIAVHQSQVNGSQRVGGLVGESYNGHGITDALVDDVGVSGISEVGGLVGRTWDGTINTILRAAVTADVTAISNMAGGIAGYTKSSDILESFAEGSVSGNMGVGGIAGYTIENAGIHNCYAVNSVAGNQYTGGVAGLFYSYHDGVSNTYFAGTVDGNSPVGGFIGAKFAGTSVANYWDTDLNSGLNSVGSGNGAGITGKTTAELSQLATYLGWDFETVWLINGSYPRLQSLNDIPGGGETPYSPATLAIQPGTNFLSNPSGVPIHIQDARLRFRATGGTNSNNADTLQVYDPVLGGFRLFFFVSNAEYIPEEFRHKWYDTGNGQIADYVLNPGTGFIYTNKATESFPWTEYPVTGLLRSRTSVHLTPNYNLIAHPYGVAVDLNETRLTEIAEPGDHVYIDDNGLLRYDWVTGSGDPELDNHFVAEGTSEVSPIPLKAGEGFYFFNAATETKIWRVMNPNFRRIAVSGIEPGPDNFLSNPMDKPINIQKAAFTENAVGNIDAYLADNISVFNSASGLTEYLYFIGEDPTVPEEYQNKWFDPVQMKPSEVLLQPGETFTYDSKAADSRVWVEGASTSTPVAVYVEIVNGFNNISNPLSVPIHLQSAGIQNPVYSSNCALADRVVVDGQPSFYCHLTGNPLSWSLNLLLEPGAGISYLRQGGDTWWQEKLLAGSKSRIDGNQLKIQRRLSNGALGQEEVFTIKGVNYSPVDINETVSSYEEHRTHMTFDNDKIESDFQSMLDMGVNTIRTYVDPGLDVEAWKDFMDKAYEYGLMVLINVRTSDFGSFSFATPHVCPAPPQFEYSKVVGHFKDHPALLGWMIGNEWNINLENNVVKPFYCYNSVHDAAEGVERTAAGYLSWTQGIKELDPDHIVASSLGFIQTYQMNGGYIDLFTPEDEVNFGEFADIFATAPSVDLWAFNLYRGNSFNTFFAQWKRAFPNKPILITEFGTDAYDHVAGSVNPQQQADTYRALWREIIRNASAIDPDRQVVGGFAFEWNDEWWKAGNPANHDASGFQLKVCYGNQVPGGTAPTVCFYGHPDDGHSNEEYYGLLDTVRNPRDAYATMMTEYQSSLIPSENVLLGARSQTGIGGQGSELSYAAFFKNGAPLALRYATEGGTPAARGYNVMVVDGNTGTPKDLRTFDMWPAGVAVPQCTEFENYAMDPGNFSPGDIVLVAVADTGTPINVPFQDCQDALVKLGSTDNLATLGGNKPYVLISQMNATGNATKCIEEIGTQSNTIIDENCTVSLPEVVLP